jgi:hypothetical protein
LPSILSQEEVAQLIDAALTPFHRVLLMTLCASEARRAELTHLKVSDIDAQRMVIRTQGGKARKDAMSCAVQSYSKNSVPIGVACTDNQTPGCFQATATTVGIGRSIRKPIPDASPMNVGAEFVDVRNFAEHSPNNKLQIIASSAPEKLATLTKKTENRSVRTGQGELANRRQHLALPIFNQRMQRLKAAAEGELSLARDHQFAFSKIDETRNAQGPLNFPHTAR